MRRFGFAIAICALILPEGARTVPRAGPNDPLGQVVALDWLLANESRRYSLLIAEPFEDVRPWRPRAASNPLSSAAYIYKTPDGPAFDREKLLVEPRSSAENLRSLFVHTSFEIPGRESYLLQPAEPIPLTGQLLRCSLWVHSNGYLHTLSLIFRNADGREVRAALGSLHWHGWRRVEVQLPPALFRRGRRAVNRYKHELTGILISSHPLAPPGDVAILLDQLLILADTSEFRYPGFELQDSW